MELWFWLSFVFVAYTYVGYPVGIWILSRFRREEPVDPAVVAEWPAVTVVITVHNEAARVAAKIENLRALDYPPERLRFLFVSDGSTDATDAVLLRAPDVTLLRYPERRGKAYALNVAMAHVETPVVVFADVRQQIERRAVRHLVARLLQTGIGAVSGELLHVDPRTRTAAHIGLYWRYEKWIRKAESRFASTVGVTGALYAMRREDYTPLQTGTLLDDFEQPMHLARRGRRVVFEPRAVMYDELQETMAGERRRKIRTLTGNFQSFARHRWLFLPWRNPLWVQFVSHKWFRLLVPYALGVMYVSSLLASGHFYRTAATLQGAFYTLSFVGAALPKLRRIRLVSFAEVFVELNRASVLALRNYLDGRVEARWEKT
ncbi:glycosyltransferase family 2 protein [Polyangium sorediatum]|uniref:Glycosyltransferase family 2 protein n=1 Tax=Polyangium sorediatum TaxID=889274 RepID=A0ABT6P9R1_9BACT|nr:glycosyltransferase family 2 protein [Polyangium sorediatum]MDI1436865.1 glycosyltransferase family 2 protein [Polyangium sorediatum]